MRNKLDGALNAILCRYWCLTRNIDCSLQRSSPFTCSQNITTR